MRLVDYLDKGASLGPQAPCLRAGDAQLTYREVQQYSDAVARALIGSGIRPGDKVAILSANDPISFSCVFGISRAAAVWCPINPRNEARENRQLLELVECRALLYQRSFADLVSGILPDLPLVETAVCLDGPDPAPVGERFDDWIASAPAAPDERLAMGPVDDVAMIAGTGGTTGLPKGVLLTSRNLETMSAIMLMSYPLGHRPRYLALAPLTHAAGVLSFPVLASGGEIIIMSAPSIDTFLELIERHRVTHTMLPPTLLYMLLDHPRLASTDLSSLECFWYGSAPMSPVRLAEAIERIGPVMAQFFGQTEAPMVATTMGASDHFRPDGSIATERLASAGRAAPLVTVAIMGPAGELLDAGERGEIVLRSSLVTPGYYRDPDATAAASTHGWHHTGDIGYLDDDGFLFIVDRAKDMIISGGFNVYSAEVEQAILEHDDVLDCAVFGLPDDRWGERVCAVVQPRGDRELDVEALRTFVRSRVGGVKAPKDYTVWNDLPRSKIGKVLKREIRASVLAQGD
ncbi:MAG: AMP-binding protein [Pseudoclavibacter sp.]